VSALTGLELAGLFDLVLCFEIYVASSNLVVLNVVLNGRKPTIDDEKPRGGPMSAVSGCALRDEPDGSLVFAGTGRIVATYDVLSRVEYSRIAVDTRKVIRDRGRRRR
jgi:hypothetical protein